MRHSPFTPKRPHRKSRGGCQGCKLRRIKCDERHPVCEYCEIRQLQCVYISNHARPNGNFLEPAFSVARSRGSSPNTPTDGSGVGNSISVPPSLASYFVEINPAGLSLMHHFVTTTAKALRFGQQNGVERVLNVHIPYLAIEHDFVLQVLLGVAALHKHHLLPDSGSHSQVIYHRAKAISGLRTAIGELSDKNSQGVLGASLFLLVLVCDPLETDDESELWTATWFVLFAGMRQIINKVSWEYLVQTGLSPLFLKDFDEPAPPSAVPGPLREMVLSAEVEEQDLEILSKTLQSLGSLYNLLKIGMCHKLGVKVGGWPANIEVGFSRLLKRMVPQALVITAYFMAFAKLPKSLWWLKGIQDREIRVIGKALGCDWQPLMLIPLQISNTQDRQEIVNLLLSHFPTDFVVLTDEMF